MAPLSVSLLPELAILSLEELLPSSLVAPLPLPRSINNTTTKQQHIVPQHSICLILSLCRTEDDKVFMYYSSQLLHRPPYLVNLWGQLLAAATSTTPAAMRATAAAAPATPAASASAAPATSAALSQRTVDVAPLPVRAPALQQLVRL